MSINHSFLITNVIKTVRERECESDKTFRDLSAECAAPRGFSELYCAPQFIVLCLNHNFTVSVHSPLSRHRFHTQQAAAFRGKALKKIPYTL